MEVILCVDCKINPNMRAKPRPIVINKKTGKPEPGPRCATHHRTHKQAQRGRQRARRDHDEYGLRPGDYERIQAEQGGTCFAKGCRARGLSRRLAVEHNHETNEVRGLACVTHNEWIGRAGDDPEVFESIAEYLRNPPARRVLTIKVNGSEVRYVDDDNV